MGVREGYLREGHSTLISTDLTTLKDLSRTQLLRCRSSRCRGWCGCRRRCLRNRTEPAGVDAGAETFRRLWIDGAFSHHAPERCLNVLARAAEPIIKIEMAECGVEVVAPEQSDHPASEPDAFRIAGRPAHLGGGFGKFIEFALGILGRVGLGGLGRFVAGLGIAALGVRAERRQQVNRRTQCNGQNTRGEVHDRAGFRDRESRLTS